MRLKIIGNSKMGFLKDSDLQDVVQALEKSGISTEFVQENSSRKIAGPGRNKRIVPKFRRRTTTLSNHVGLLQKDIQRHKSVLELDPRIVDDLEYDKEMFDLVTSRYALVTVKDLSLKYELNTEVVRKTLYRHNALGITIAGKKNKFYPIIQFAKGLNNIAFEKNMAAAINSLRKCELTDMEILYWLVSPITVKGKQYFSDVDAAIEYEHFDKALQLLAKPRPLTRTKELIPLTLVEKGHISSFYQLVEREMDNDLSQTSHERGVEDVVHALEVLAKYNISAELTSD